MKRIALIVSSAALLVAGSGVASAARSIILPYPAELMSKAQRLAPDTTYRLLNPLSQKKQTASYLSGAYVPGGSSAAVAKAIQRAGTPKKTKKTSRVTVPSTSGKVFDSTGGYYDPARSIYVPGPNSPTSSMSPPPASPGWIIINHCGDFLGCSANQFLPLPNSQQ
jgi:hypothetical protein